MRLPPDLATVQTEFRNAVFQPTREAAVLARMVEDAAVARRRLAAYRASAHGILISALAASYPVLLRLVGEAFFRAAARRYLSDHPSFGGDLNDYGDEFADFLAGDGPAAGLPYLPDVARLEWAVQRVYYAADAKVDFSSLAHTPAQVYGSLRFDTAPAHARLDSAWPVARIWRLNQADFAEGDASVDLSRAESVLVWRHLGQVQVDSLTRADAAFFDALAAGHDLAGATACVSQIWADFDPGPVLARLVQREILTGAHNGLVAQGAGHE